MQKPYKSSPKETIFISLSFNSSHLPETILCLKGIPLTQTLRSKKPEKKKQKKFPIRTHKSTGNVSEITRGLWRHHHHHHHHTATSHFADLLNLHLTRDARHPNPGSHAPPMGGAFHTILLLLSSLLVLRCPFTHQAELLPLPCELRHGRSLHPLPQPPVAPSFHDRFSPRLCSLVLPLLR